MAEREKPRLLRVQVVNPDGSKTMRTVREDEIRTNQQPGNPLTAEQLARAEEMHARFINRMVPMPLEELIQNLEKERNPDREMDIWESMSRIANKLWDHPISKPYTRKQIDHAVVAVSVNAVDIPARVGVSDELVAVMHKLIEEDRAAHGLADHLLQ